MEKSRGKIIPYVLIHIHNFVEMLNYSKKITLLKQTISQHEQRLLVKSTAWTCHSSVYIPFEDNLNFLCCSQITIPCL